MRYLTILFFVLFAFSCGQKSEESKPFDASQAIEQTGTEQKPKVTFIELGSTTCIPCVQMKKVMKQIEEKFGLQVKVVFIDVNKEKDKVDEYKISIIPTQVFLDASGKEFHRHEGYYPESEISELLKAKGLKSIEGAS